MGQRTSEVTDDPKPVELKTAVSDLLEESRMLLPGTQTLFGFQLIVVFNGSFDQLSAREQHLHFAAMLLTVLAIALCMAPAAYHRQIEPEEQSRRFLIVSSRMLALGTLPLALAISTEIYLVSSLIADPVPVSIGAALFVLAIFACLWYLLPRLVRRPR